MVVINIATDDGGEFEIFGLDLIGGGLALEYRGYSFPLPIFVAGGVNDFSVLGTLHFEALTDNAGVVFGSGALIRLDVTASTEPDGGVSTIDVIPDFFSIGFDAVPASAGETFTINVTPEPATLVLLGLGGLVARRRRRAQVRCPC